MLADTATSSPRWPCPSTHLPLAGTDWRRRRQPRSLPATMGRAGPAHAGRPAARLRLRIAAAGRLLREQPRSRPARAPAVAARRHQLARRRGQSRSLATAGRGGRLRRKPDRRIPHRLHRAQQQRRVLRCVWPLRARGRPAGRRRPAGRGRRNRRAAQNTASTTCAAFPACCRPTTAGLRRALPESAGRTGTPSCPRTPRPRRPSSTRKRDAGRHLLPGRRQLRRHRRARPAGWPRFRAGGRACGSTTCGPSPASSPAGPGTGAPAMPGIDIVHWTRRRRRPDAGDVVIEAFACDPPDAFLDAMRQVHPVWINLEYLSAEVWIESCHGLPSQRPDGLVKHFYFPGFTPATGGLLREPGLSAERDALQASPEQQESVLRAGRQHARRAGATAPPRVLFCYPDAPSTHWPRPWPPIRARPCCWRPKAWRPAWKRPAPRRAARPGQAAFVSQPDFDRLLWCADLNFVRGEDSFVRPPGPRVRWSGRSTRSTTRSIWTSSRPGWPATRHRRRPALIRAWNQPDSPQALGPALAAALAPEAWQAWARAAVTGTQPRPTGPIWRKIWPHFAQSWPRNARIESFLRSPDAIGPQNTDASRGVHKIENPREIRIRPPDDGDGGPGSTRR